MWLQKSWTISLSEETKANQHPCHLSCPVDLLLCYLCSMLQAACVLNRGHTLVRPGLVVLVVCYWLSVKLTWPFLWWCVLCTLIYVLQMLGKHLSEVLDVIISERVRYTGLYQGLFNGVTCRLLCSSHKDAGLMLFSIWHPFVISFKEYVKIF